MRIVVTKQILVEADDVERGIVKMFKGEGNVVSTSVFYSGQQQLRITKPGDLFSFLIYELTGQSSYACGVCFERKQKMNDWNWRGCWKNRKVIAGWLAQEAKNRGHQVSESNVLGLMRAALKELRKRRFS